LVLMLDDAGYNDVGYNSTDAVTPHIDSVARDGIRLSRFYAGSGICSPSRAAFLTGQSPMRYGLNRLWETKPANAQGERFLGQRGLPDEDKTLAQSLQGEGYKTLQIGRWHLGTSETKFLPGGKGYDDFTVVVGDNPLSGSFRAITPAGNSTVQSEWQSKYQADRIISHIDERIAASESVFIHWSPPEPHTAYTPSDGEYYYTPPTFDRAAFEKDSGGKAIDLSTDRGKMLSMLYSVDQQFGRVLDHINRRNLYDEALIIVTGDNGSSRRALSPSHEFQEAKGTLFEGGLRVPFAASWPKRFKAGTHTNTAMSMFDIYPTIMGLIGGPVPGGIEGSDLSSLLLQGTGSRGPLFFELLNAHFRGREDETYYDTYAVIDGCEKLIIWLGREHYYNLCNDPNERSHLGNAPGLTRMRTLLRSNRLRVSRFADLGSMTAATPLGMSERLNIHQDDLAVYATVNLGSDAAGSHNIYRRGEGVNLRLEGDRLVATVTGVADTSLNPALRTVSLSAQVPRDGRSHRLGFVIRGYLHAASTISLYVDGQVQSRLLAPLGVSFNPGSSVLAVKSEAANAELGANGLAMSDVLVLTNAIEPNEF
jgi:arylsulfatase A-like enzyme